MRRSVLPLLMALAVMAVVTGGAAASGQTGVSLAQTTDDGSADGPPTTPTHPMPMNDSREASPSGVTGHNAENGSACTDAGICLVRSGTTEEKSTHPHNSTEAAGHANDDRSTCTDAGICLVGSDTGDEDHQSTPNDSGTGDETSDLLVGGIIQNLLAALFNLV